jgi:hypothetical protein
LKTVEISLGALDLSASLVVVSHFADCFLLQKLPMLED